MYYKYIYLNFILLYLYFIANLRGTGSDLFTIIVVLSKEIHRFSVKKSPKNKLNKIKYKNGKEKKKGYLICFLIKLKVYIAFFFLKRY